MSINPSSFPAAVASPRLTGLDTARSKDRSRVHHARGHRRQLLWLLAGPGILAMLGENDGPSMIAYASDGAQYGLGFFVPFTLSGGRYWRWERIVLGLAGFNGLFLLAAILVKPHAGAVVSSLDFLPFPSWSFNTLLLLLASTVGATVTPWMTSNTAATTPRSAPFWPRSSGPGH